MGMYNKYPCKQGKKKKKNLIHSSNYEIQKVLLENVKQVTLQDFFTFKCNNKSYPKCH